MREILAASLYSSDLEPAEWEVSIDRIGALRGSSALGSALFRWRFGQDRSSRGKAYVLTLKLASRKLRIAPRHPVFQVLRRAVKQALVEWAQPQCRACSGAATIHVDRQAGLSGIDHICMTCGGTGSHRYGDIERRDALGVDKLGEWTNRLSLIRNLISAHEIGVSVGARRELER
jgi:hypothetical protein